MPTEILMPALSPTMEEGTLAKWLVKEGDEVSSGDLLAEIETDKATMEFEAVDEGTVGKIMVAEGTEGVRVNTPIAVLLAEGEDASAIDEAEPDGSSHAAPHEGSQQTEPAKGYGRNPHAGADHGEEPTPPPAGGGETSPTPKGGGEPSRPRPDRQEAPRSERPRRRAHLRLPPRPAHREGPRPGSGRHRGLRPPRPHRQGRRRERRAPGGRRAGGGARRSAAGDEGGSRRRGDPHLPGDDPGTDRPLGRGRAQDVRRPRA